MPFDIIKQHGEYNVVNQATGDVKGTFKTRKQAEKQLRVLDSVVRTKETPGVRGDGNTTLNSSYQPEPITHGFVNGRKFPVAAGPQDAETGPGEPVPAVPQPAPAPAPPVGSGIAGLIARAGKGKKTAKKG